MNTNNTLTYWQYNIATGAHSVIAGGNANTVTGACSAILGGSGNSDGGFALAGIYGNGINAVANDTFHINNLWVNPGTYQNFAGIAPFGTFPSGTVYVDTAIGAGLPLRMAP